MTVIIAEKPSLARNIVEAIGPMQKNAGFFAGEKYIVTYAFGHLFSLADIEDYSPAPEGERGWTMKNLPCFPENFKYSLRRDATKKVDAGVKRQFETIKALCSRPDVDAIVNAGDSDREGEIIIRTCVNETNIQGKKLLRLWLPDQTPQTIRAALSQMKDESEYENLANEGFARTYMDWLYGVNLTRYASIKSGTLLRVGRVIVPIVKAIYDRDMAIRAFKPEKYFALVGHANVRGEDIELTSKNKFAKSDEAAARATCEKYSAADAGVVSVKNKRDTLFPKKLYSLTKLQNALGKKYKMSMENSLSVLQGLYEKGYVTYPRTNSEYLATAEKDKIKEIIAGVKKLGYPVVFKDKKTIFDDSKIEAHSALTPTYKIPDKTKLSPDETKVYAMIMRRFVAVFCSEECLIDKTEINIDLGGLEDFTLKGSVIVSPGWTKYDDFSQKDKILPKLEKGEIIHFAFAPEEKETTPPKHYTIETLNNYLKNPFKEEKAAESDNDDDEYKAIFEGLELGTEATRTGIIDNARKSGYIELKKDVYTILPDGERFIEALSRMGIVMDKFKTAEFGKSLKKVYRGEFTIRDSLEIAEKEINAVFTAPPSPPETDLDNGFFGEIVGKCPLCGRDVVRFKKSYGCSGYKEGCKFIIGDTICSRSIPASAAKSLLATGKSAKLVGFISKAGKPFDAALILEDGKVKFDFQR